MTQSPTDVLLGILANPTDLANVRSHVTDDVRYVSLNYEDADLKKIMPWCGSGGGAERIVKTFVDVGRFWKNEAFEIEAKFDSGEHVAIFGRFQYRSTVLGKVVTSPFAVFARVRDGRCYYMQFMEDTFATAASFRSGGAWTFRSDPDGAEVTI
jgi:ketosteroid isomerase-like protein